MPRGKHAGSGSREGEYREVKAAASSPRIQGEAIAKLGSHDLEDVHLEHVGEQTNRSNSGSIAIAGSGGRGGVTG